MGTDLRTAAQQALEALDWYAECAMVSDKASDAASALRAALEQPVQEPVAWIIYTQDGKSVCVTDNTADFIKWRSFPLYTHPPRREWRGLSGEEVDQIAGNTVDAWECARAIEAALKERNV